jgi:aspartyl-tRNA(Asn)/glutamyl-tRNA(Gln) amidotransferase subunit C
MKKVSLPEVKKLARLCKLYFKEEEYKSLVKELNKILDYFSKIDEVQISATSPCFYISKKRMPLREDKSFVSKIGKEVVLNSPQREGTNFIVPKVW